MLCIESLKAFGANTDEGVARCVNNEAFYLRLVGLITKDHNFDKLESAIRSGDATAAFEAAHALKGALGNLSLTPLVEPMKEITELLRAGSVVGCEPLLAAILEKKRELEAL